MQSGTKLDQEGEREGICERFKELFPVPFSHCGEETPVFASSWPTCQVTPLKRAEFVNVTWVKTKIKKTLRRYNSFSTAFQIK